MKIDNSFYNLNECDICFAGIPYIASKTPIPLSVKAPDILRYGLNHKDDYDEITGKCVFDSFKICDYGSIKTSEVKKILCRDKKFFFIGGEHSITLPIIKAFYDFNPDFYLIVFDAHLDLRKDYEPNACFLRKILDFFPAERILLVGQRVFSQEEYDFMKENNLKRVSDVNIKGKKVYVSFDIDCLDSVFVPSASTPEPMGLSIEQAETLLKKIVKNNTLLGADFVEFASDKYDITYSNISYLLMSVLKTLLKH